MKFILGKKVEMTQRFDEKGIVTPVTVVQAGPCVITQVKDIATDGYKAVQVGFGKKKSLSRALKGHLKNVGLVRTLKEFRTEANEGSFEAGQKITVGVFEKGERVSIAGTSKGKGFQGVVRRHGFHGSLKTHGHKDQVRMPGAIGAGGPQHVFKGTRMGGRMGGDQITVPNLEIIDIDLERGLLFIKGAVPGHRNSVISVVGKGEMDLSTPPVVTAEETPAPVVEESMGEITVTPEETPAEETPKDAPIISEAPAAEKTEATEEAK